MRSSEITGSAEWHENYLLGCGFLPDQAYWFYFNDQTGFFGTPREFSTYAAQRLAVRQNDYYEWDDDETGKLIAYERLPNHTPFEFGAPRFEGDVPGGERNYGPWRFVPDPILQPVSISLEPVYPVIEKMQKIVSADPSRKYLVGCLLEETKRFYHERTEGGFADLLLRAMMASERDGQDEDKAILTLALDLSDTFQKILAGDERGARSGLLKLLNKDYISAGRLREGK